MAESEVKSFHEMELDDRILKAIARLGWTEPTLIQEKAIPLALQGKDVLVKARTGSGKTAAFAIPIIQKILLQKPLSREQVIRALILAPSKELCNQIHRNIKELTIRCSKEITCLDISPQVNLTSQKQLLVERPDIIISTPSRIVAHLKAKNLTLNQSLEMIVIDEADLIFSFGYEEDVKQLLGYFPKVYQAILASATLSKQVVSLKQFILHNPVTLKLEEPELPPTTQLSHYHISAEEHDKAVILYVLFKLHLIRGKTIIFVNTVDKCYRLKLFLEQFAIPSCVLNSELPAVMRCHSVMQFNEGLFDLIIASDEHILDDPKNPELNKSKRRKDKESGVSRGIDFQFVANIVNFDFPKSITSYIHRAGRTARGKNEGTALSFVSVKERSLLEDIESHLKAAFDHDSNQPVISPYEFKLEEVEGFRYRARDAWKAVTRIAVREARIKEIRREILNSSKLKSYFEDNPRDLECLRGDKAFHTIKLQPHLADVPEYIIPDALKNMQVNAGVKRKKLFKALKVKPGKKESDPLLSFDFDGFKKKKRKQK